MKRPLLSLMLSAMLAPQIVVGAEISRNADAVTVEQAAATFQKAGMTPAEARTRAESLDQAERAQLARHGVGPKGGVLTDRDLIYIILIIVLIAVLL